MNVYWLTGTFTTVDGVVDDDFESLPVGPVTALPEVDGTGGCKFEASTFVPR